MSNEAERAALAAAVLAPAPDEAVRAALADGWLGRLIPELRTEMDIEQRTPWHDRTVLEHSLATMAALPPRLDERLAGLLHDVGKRRTVSTRPDGREQYLGHAAVGAEMAREILARLGFEGALVERVVGLVRDHMDIHVAADNPPTRRGIGRLLRRIGDRFEVLARLSLADTAAMAPAVAAEKLGQERAFIELVRADAAFATGAPEAPEAAAGDPVAGNAAAEAAR